MAKNIKVRKLPCEMRVLFLTRAGAYRTQMCLSVKKELKNMYPTLKCMILEFGEKQRQSIPYWKKILDKEGIYLAEKTMEKFSPHIIVVTSDTDESATFIKLARMKKIPTLAILGLIAETRQKTIINFLRWNSYLLWRLLSRVSRISSTEKLAIFIGWRTHVLDYGLGGADVYAVMGNYSKRILVSRGVLPQRIIITGYPHFDEFRRLSYSEKEGIKQQLKLDKRPVMLLATQAFVEDGIWKLHIYRRLMKSVIQAADQLKLQLVIKLHPRENIEKYKEIIQEKVDENIIIVENFDLQKLLNVSDMVMTVNSTVGLWALVYRKPLITIACFPTWHYNVYEDVAIQVKSLEKLTEVLREVIENKTEMSEMLRRTMKTVDEHIYKADEKASRRVASLIIKLAKIEHDITTSKKGIS